MKVYNSPAQARSLREIEATALSESIKMMEEINGTVQPIRPSEEKEEEKARPETQAKAASQKARSKKDSKTV